MDVEPSSRAQIDVGQARPWLADAIAVIVTIVLVIGFGILRVDFRHLQHPVYFVGDENLMLEYVKNALQSGPIPQDAQLAYPGHVNLASFPVFDTLSILVVKIISLFTSDAVIGSNLLAYSDHVLSAAIGFACFRVLRLERTAAAACAVAFAWTEFGLNTERVIGHLSLQLYAPLAIGATLALLPMVRPEALAARSTWVLASVGAIVIGLSQPYWVAFSLLAIVTAGLGYAMVADWRATVLLGACAVLMTAIAASCVLWPRLLDGPAISIQRSPVEQAIYGLRLGDMLTPSRSHLPWLNAVHDRYMAVRGDMNEGWDSFVGWPGLIGLGIAAAVLLRSPFRRSGHGSAVALASVLLAVLVGFTLRYGGGDLFNRIVTPYIRAQNRVSPMIAFLAIFVFAASALRLGSRTLRLRRTAVAAVTFIAALGLYDQSFGVSFAKMQADSRTMTLWAQARADAEALQAALPAGSTILQLPFMVFPESPPVGDLGSYDEVNLALFTRGYRFSFGLPSAPSFIEPKSIVSTAIGAAAAGFDEILVYRAGYPQGIDDMVASLQASLGLKVNVDTADFVGLGLGPLQQSLPRLPPAALNVRATWDGGGFSQLEAGPGYMFRWDDSADAVGKVTIDNADSVSVPMRFCGTLAPGTPGDYRATVDAAGQVTRVSIDQGGTAVNIGFDAPPGRSILSVSLPAPRITYAPTDPRHMHFQLRKPVVASAALLDRTKAIAQRLSEQIGGQCK